MGTLALIVGLVFALALSIAMLALAGCLIVGCLWGVARSLR